METETEIEIIPLTLAETMRVLREAEEHYRTVSPCEVFTECAHSTGILAVHSALMPVYSYLKKLGKTDEFQRYRVARDEDNAQRRYEHRRRFDSPAGRRREYESMLSLMLDEIEAREAKKNEG